MKQVTIKPISPRFLIGSAYFFNQYVDFKPKDIDELEIVISNTDNFNVRHFLGKNYCLFQLRQLNSVDEYIACALATNCGMVAGKFLVPEFNKEIGFCINDLIKIKPLIDLLDIKHQYEKIIYDAYLLNQDFILTAEQRDAAYASYKLTRET